MVKPQNNQSLAKPLRNVWISPYKDSSLMIKNSNQAATITSINL